MSNVGFVCHGVSLRLPKLALGLSTCCTSGDTQTYRPSFPSLEKNAVLDPSFNFIRNPPEVAFRRKKCLVLWLRIGSLRLTDNCLVRAVSGQSGDAYLLPVITVQRKDVSCSLLAAIHDLKVALESLGSTAVVHAADNSFQAELDFVLNLSTEVRAKTVFVHTASDVSLGSATFSRSNHGGKLHVVPSVDSLFSHTLSCNRHGYCSLLCDGPKTLPRPPSMRNLASNLCVEGAEVKGEAAARTKLEQLLCALNPSKSKEDQFELLLTALSEELRIGCLSPARIHFELQRTRHNGNVSLKDKYSNWKAGHDFLRNGANYPVFSAMSIAAYDVNGGDRRGVDWDEESKSFVLKEWEHTETERRMNPQERWNEFWRRRRLFFMRSFFPDDVTPDYYSFTAWRFAQRCCSATIGVFGTQSLLFAIGIKSGRIGQAAVISWVLKDGLGRVGKMIWAGSMGKDFDVDPKRWRFRSALLYALGNGLEIVTQIFPASFLLFATAANSMKQVSMLTASATRNAMYRSFSGSSQNIANITAKGEAQIVVADLIGMGCGIRLSKVFGASKKNVLGMYFLLTAMDIFGIYMELRQVVFRTLNAERSGIMVNHYIRHGRAMTPSEVSPRESIFMKPRYMSHMRLTSIAKAAKDPTELAMLLRVFKREHFLVSIPRARGSGPCRLVLRKDASNEDVLRAILMIGYIDQHMKKHKKKTISLEEEECILTNAWKTSKRQFPVLLQAAQEAGWNTDSLLFSTMKRRGYW